MLSVSSRGCCRNCRDLFCDPKLFRSVQSFKILEAASVDFDDLYPDLYFHRAIFASPRIRRYRWSNSQDGTDLVPATIEHLSLQYLSPGRVVELFSFAKRLRSVAFAFAVENRPLRAILAPISLLHLTTLDVLIIDRPQNLFNILTLPALSDLQIFYSRVSAVNAQGPCAFTSLGGLLARSQCKLDRLAIFANEACDEDRAELLNMLRSSEALQNATDLLVPVSHEEIPIVASSMRHLRRFRVRESHSPPGLLMEAVAQAVIRWPARNE